MFKNCLRNRHHRIFKAVTVFSTNSIHCISNNNKFQPLLSWRVPARASLGNIVVLSCVASWLNMEGHLPIVGDLTSTWLSSRRVQLSSFGSVNGPERSKSEPHACLSLHQTWYCVSTRETCSIYLSPRKYCRLWIQPSSLPTSLICDNWIA